MKKKELMSYLVDRYYLEMLPWPLETTGKFPKLTLRAFTKKERKESIEKILKERYPNLYKDNNTVIQL